jgi:hypothetical protein
MHTPGWLLLVWSGAAATCAAAVAGAIFSARRRAWLLLPGRTAGAADVLASLAAGALAYPVLYGVAFELIGRADLPVGLALGLLHGVVMVLATGPRSRTGLAFRNGAMHLVYGATIAFLYVTP